jgi:hypothetical protein
MYSINSTPAAISRTKAYRFLKKRIIGDLFRVSIGNLPRVNEAGSAGLLERVERQGVERDSYYTSPKGYVKTT